MSASSGNNLRKTGTTLIHPMYTNMEIQGGGTLQHLIKMVLPEMGQGPKDTRNSHISCPGLWILKEFQNCTKMCQDTAEERGSFGKKSKLELLATLSWQCQHEEPAEVQDAGCEDPTW